MSRSIKEMGGFFHDPDVSWPVIAHRLADEFLFLLAGVGEIMATQGRCILKGHSVVDREAFRSASYRLRKAGLVAYKQKGRQPVLILTEEGRSKMPDACRPERFWNKKWNGIWYVLIYDVPEKRRVYRDTLRGFLVRKRMGCLQRSVWVSASDIRSEYADLVEAAQVDEHAFLLESTTVLGQSPQEIAVNAWDFDRLDDIHRWYCERGREALARVQSDRLSMETLMTLAREEMSAYLLAMKEDPLLPRDLWPAGYGGAAVYDLHLRIVSAAGVRL